jgi:hypothetical protein
MYEENSKRKDLSFSADARSFSLFIWEEEQQRPDKRYFYSKLLATLPFKKINEALKLRPVKAKPGTAAYYRERVMDKRDCSLCGAFCHYDRMLLKQHIDSHIAY